MRLAGKKKSSASDATYDESDEQTSETILRSQDADEILRSLRTTTTTLKRRIARQVSGGR
jgi:hypothetical protein